MTVEIVVKNSSGVVVAEYRGDACIPGEYKTLINRPETETQGNAVIQYYGFVYQPRLQRSLTR